MLHRIGALLVLVPSLSLGAEAPPPMMPAPPASVGVNAEKLGAAVEFAIANESTNPRDLLAEHEINWGREPYDGPIGPLKDRGDMTGVIVRSGHIIARWGEPQRVDMTFSVSKSYLSTTVGLAWDDKLIPDLHAPVHSLVPIEEFESEHNIRVTWDHLLRQTSDWEGMLFGKPDWADRPGQDLRVARERERYEPGEMYKYNDVRVNALALAALHVWRRPLPEVLRERIMDPIGASDTWRWHGYTTSWVEIDTKLIQSVSGGGHWGGGMFINADDHARFAQLLLSRGRWGDEQLISEAWVKLAETPTDAGNAHSSRFGPLPGFMNFFVNTNQERLPSAPASAVIHLGSGTNMLYIDREHDLVIVARWIDRSAIDEFVGMVLDSIESAPTTEP